MVAESSQIKLFLGTKKYDTFGGERGVLMHKHSPRLPGGGGKPKKSRLGPAYKKTGRAELTYLFWVRGGGIRLTLWFDGGPSRLSFWGRVKSTYLRGWVMAGTTLGVGALYPFYGGGRGALHPSFPITCRFRLFLQLEVNKRCIFSKQGSFRPG